MSLKSTLSSSLKSQAFALGLAILLSPALSGAQVPPPMPAEKAMQIYGQSVHYYDAGQGPAPILVHGLGGQAANWAANIGPLSGNHHVYALDQIGFDHSDKPLIDYKIATFVDFLQSFMQTLGIPKATLVGNSLGGWIAVDFTAQHPAIVDRLVLVGAAGLRSEGGPTRSLLI
jgi:pimeloyl-ACP methyl ester carboxylesterase